MGQGKEQGPADVITQLQTAGPGREGCLSQLIQPAADSKGLCFSFNCSSQNSETRKKNKQKRLGGG